MANIRIIPRLDIKGSHLVKGIHLEGLRVLGRPEDFARHYYAAGADELIFMDVVASLYDRNSLHEVVAETAKNVFVPITVGGGVRTLEDIRRLLNCGADKVAINTAAVKNPQFIRDAANTFGSSTIVGVIEAIKQADGKYYAFIDNGREESGLEVVEWAKRLVDLGAGELMITSVDREGTGLGFDQQLISQILPTVSVPVIAHGGAGEVTGISRFLNDCHVSAIALSSILHYQYIQTNAQLLKNHSIEAEGNVEFLRQGRGFNKIKSITLPNLKQELSTLGQQISSHSHPTTMTNQRSRKVTIVDYGMGNIFSLRQVLGRLGAEVCVTSDVDEIERSDAVILPGVGAFGEAMAQIRAKNLISVLKSKIQSRTPFFGICLGMQLLMSRSFEFGEHEGLNAIDGEVLRFPARDILGEPLRVPSIGWRKITKPEADPKFGNLLQDFLGEQMYFVHSFYVHPHLEGVSTSESDYGGVQFCASFERGNLFATQFHPEKSGEIGLAIVDRWLTNLG
jgi:cyclase